MGEATAEFLRKAYHGEKNHRLTSETNLGGSGKEITEHLIC